MKRMKYLPIVLLVLALLVPAFVLAEPPDKGGAPDDYLGGLYGDLYIILRDANGIPLLDSYGCVQPTRVEDQDGVLTLVVQPLYTNEAEDIYCELTADMVDWVQEVDFGRLNLGRAPEGVLEHAFDEAINALNAAQDIQLDPAGRFLLTLVDGEKTIDSPLENLALYIKIMKDGHLITLDTDGGGKGRGGSGGPSTEKGPPEGDGPSEEPRPVLDESAIQQLSEIGYGGLGIVGHELNNDDLLLAASLLAAAADKSGSFTIDKVVYVNSIYGINQLGALPGEVDGKMYFDFSQYGYVYPYGGRQGGECSPGWVYVLQSAGGTSWIEGCVNISDTVRFEPVDFVVSNVPHEGAGAWEPGVGNVAGFTQAANDALKVIEYIHNYSVPEDIYAATP